jgi:aspartate-semialdehyde dehydrogenase
VLGCTGSVGQRFILLLGQHPHFTLHTVGASSRSAGKKYKDAVKWKQAAPMGKHVEELVVKECKASEFADCDIVFSGLDADVAGEIGKFACFCVGLGKEVIANCCLQRWNF